MSNRGLAWLERVDAAGLGRLATAAIVLHFAAVVAAPMTRTPPRGP
jgi:hypothetical protein